MIDLKDSIFLFKKLENVCQKVVLCLENKKDPGVYAVLLLYCCTLLDNMVGALEDIYKKPHKGKTINGHDLTVTVVIPALKKMLLELELLATENKAH